MNRSGHLKITVTLPGNLQNSFMKISGLDGSVLLWAVPVQAATTVVPTVPTVEHITSEMKLDSKLKLCSCATH